MTSQHRKSDGSSSGKNAADEDDEGDEDQGIYSVNDGSDDKDEEDEEEQGIYDFLDGSAEIKAYESDEDNSRSSKQQEQVRDDDKIVVVQNEHALMSAAAKKTEDDHSLEQSSSHDDAKEEEQQGIESLEEAEHDPNTATTDVYSPEMKEPYTKEPETREKERKRRSEGDANLPLIAESKEEDSERFTTPRRSAESKRGGRRESNVSKIAPWRRLLGMGKSRHDVGDLVEAEWEGSGWWFVGYVAGIEKEGDDKGIHHIVFADGDKMDIQGRFLRQLGPPGTY